MSFDHTDGYLACAWDAFVSVDGEALRSAFVVETPRGIDVFADVPGLAVGLHGVNIQIRWDLHGSTYAPQSYVASVRAEGGLNCPDPELTSFSPAGAYVGPSAVIRATVQQADPNNHCDVEITGVFLDGQGLMASTTNVPGASSTEAQSGFFAVGQQDHTVVVSAVSRNSFSGATSYDFSWQFESVRPDCTPHLTHNSPTASYASASATIRALVEQPDPYGACDLSITSINLDGSSLSAFVTNADDHSYGEADTGLLIPGIHTVQVSALSTKLLEGTSREYAFEWQFTSLGVTQSDETRPTGGFTVYDGGLSAVHVQRVCFPFEGPIYCMDPFVVTPPANYWMEVEIGAIGVHHAADVEYVDYGPYRYEPGQGAPGQEVCPEVCTLPTPVFDVGWDELTLRVEGDVVGVPVEREIVIPAQSVTHDAYPIPLP